MSSATTIAVRISLCISIMTLPMPAVFSAESVAVGPKFEDYAVTIRTEAPAGLQGNFPDLPAQARDELNTTFADGINFAGTATIAVWGCGTGCMSGGVFDARTEKWFEFPFAIHRSVQSDSADKAFSFRHDSRLLIITGLCNEERDGQFHFVWDGRQLVPLDAPALACLSD
ncbi:MAG: hypothetical protein RLP98_14435 [Devosia sp.]